jgi:hypothetical protein
VVILALVFAHRGNAQDTARVSPDSISERLRRAEEAIALLRQQLEAQSSTAVETRSRIKAELSGRVLVNAFSNTGRVNNVDVPQIALLGTPRGSAGGAIRQTALGIAVTGARAIGADFVGDVNMDFYGGQMPSSGGRTFPLVRLRTARARLTWNRTEILVGQEVPLVNGLNPSSLASLGTPDFVAAGNLWLWLPQVRVSHDVGSVVRLGVQGAVLAPTSGDAAAFFDTEADLAERTKRPYLQGRARVSWGEGVQAGEMGVGVHRGWLDPARGDRVTSKAVTIDARVPIRMLEIVAEAYEGEAVRGLGGGGIGQNLDTLGRAVRDRGGWVQLNLRPSSMFELGGGCGVNYVRGVIAVAAPRRRNETCESHVAIRPGGPAVIGLEYRRTETTHAAGRARNTHLNLALGFEF